MRSANRFTGERHAVARTGVVILSLISLLTSYWGVTGKAQISGPAKNQGPAAIRIMPPDGSAFLVEQRFDIRAEAPAGVESPLRVSLDGRDISDWNNRNRMTGSSITPPSPTITKASAFLSRDW